ncbi:hypothetical protein BKH42_08715 [Helicobacter sp. 13S00482-2]|uniref:hypothetical protein n=1 Tax=Helicobacter sp. 13S00482-2 TaxID=1476200 RepID=UPI000BA5A2BE|nr:hypothetical protein [Helicobacter sp. 13S00482-2]PAF52918.1 hypothetical protein BKH42_08715 [Helicobacter sp. 13S00482-2]
MITDRLGQADSIIFTKEFATKSDLEAIKVILERQFAELKQDIARSRVDVEKTRTEIANVRTGIIDAKSELNKKIRETRSQLYQETIKTNSKLIDIKSTVGMIKFNQELNSLGFCIMIGTAAASIAVIGIVDIVSKIITKFF